MLFSPVVRITKAATVAIVAVALLSDAGFACRSSLSPKAVLLEVVPTEAQDAPVIARVVIKNLYPDIAPGQPDYQPGYATAEVIQAIRGVEVGNIIKIRKGTSFCNTALHRDDVGRDGFVAGEFDRHQTLEGFWDLRHSRNNRQP